MVARGRWALLTDRLNRAWRRFRCHQARTLPSIQRSVHLGWIILYMGVMISREKVVRNIYPMHPFTYRPSQALHKCTRDSSNPPCSMFQKPMHCSSHLLVPLEALDRDRLESLVLRSELSLPRLELASNGDEECQDNSLALV